MGRFIDEIFVRNFFLTFLILVMFAISYLLFFSRFAFPVEGKLHAREYASVPDCSAFLCFFFFS